MRDKLIHDYFGVDLDAVWLTARDDVPVLKVEVARLLAESLAICWITAHNAMSKCRRRLKSNVRV